MMRAWIERDWPPPNKRNSSSSLPLDLGYNINFFGSSLPAYTTDFGLTSLYNYVTQFLKISVSLSLYIYIHIHTPYLFCFLENPITNTHLKVALLSWGINFLVYTACCTHGQRGSGGQRMTLCKVFQVLEERSLGYQLGKLPTECGWALIGWRSSKETLLHCLIGSHGIILWHDY